MHSHATQYKTCKGYLEVAELVTWAKDHVCLIPHLYSSGDLTIKNQRVRNVGFFYGVHFGKSNVVVKNDSVHEFLGSKSIWNFG